jgi:hypothetical protein
MGNVFCSYDGHSYLCFDAINTSININAVPFVSTYNFNLILATIYATSQYFIVIHWHTNHWLYIPTSMVLYIDEMYLHQYNSCDNCSEDGCFGRNMQELEQWNTILSPWLLNMQLVSIKYGTYNTVIVFIRSFNSFKLFMLVRSECNLQNEHIYLLRVKCHTAIN